MRKSFIFLFISCCVSIYSAAQTAEEIISAVRKSQRLLTNISYRVVRHDTLVTGDVRTLMGHAKIHVDSSDRTFGFHFWAKDDAGNSQLVFNGNMSFQTDDAEKTYSISTDQSTMKELLFRSGGRIVVPDLVRLDTAGAIGFTAAQDPYFYYLTMIYPDLTKYDVTKRYKTIKIDKLNMLPAAVTQHQETLGKVQNLAWNIQQMSDKDFDYDFTEPDFVKTFTLKVPAVSGAHPLMKLKGKQAPSFGLKSFADRMVSSSKMAGKVVLLDFWEVWCGPCVESMPKIQHLYDKFKDKGFMVLGIINDVKQLESSKKFVQRRPEIQFPMLVGNGGLKKDYLVDAVPQYVLIGRDGKIRFVSLGNSGEVEGEIEKALEE